MKSYYDWSFRFLRDNYDDILEEEIDNKLSSFDHYIIKSLSKNVANSVYTNNYNRVNDQVLQQLIFNEIKKMKKGIVVDIMELAIHVSNYIYANAGRLHLKDKLIMS